MTSANKKTHYTDQYSNNHYFYTGFQDAFPGHPSQIDAQYYQCDKTEYDSCNGGRGSAGNK
jgi:hypothetical protein